MPDFGGSRARVVFAAVIVAALIAALIIEAVVGDDGADTSSPATSPSARSTASTDEAEPPAVEGPSAEPARPSVGEGLPQEIEQALDGVPDRATTPAQVAEQIEVAERAIEDPDTPGKVLAAAAHLQQVAYRVLGARPKWDEQVLADVPGRLHRVVRDNLVVRREFRSMHDELVDTLPAWRIIPPAKATRLRAYYQEGERAYGVDWEYLAAVNLVETAMGRIRGTSIAGAQGPMQFIPSTWATWGRGDINDPRDAIMAAARYLDAMGFGSSPQTALLRYNNSSAYVRGVTLLAELMKRRPRAFIGYYHWQVYYLSSQGDVLLPVGYSRQQPVKVTDYLDETGAEAYRP